MNPIGSAYGYELQYSAVGSGGGVAAVTARTVDFGASDAPLTADQFNACNGCVQIPWALSGDGDHLQPAGRQELLKMDGPTLAKIFMGQITTWDDPAIQKLNKGVNLPSTKITIDPPLGQLRHDVQLHRLPLDRQSGLEVGARQGCRRELAGGLGPARKLRRRGSVQQTTGGIGYADVAYSLGNHLKFFAMKNRSASTRRPACKGILAAATSDQKPAAITNELSIVNPPKRFPLAYPISTYTYVIVPTQVVEGGRSPEVALLGGHEGPDSHGPKLLFQPIPKPVLVVAEKTIKKIQS